ncbi:Eco29kI family restriction endonuclease [Bradyrhizobium sp. MOS002]|uniref:Eco29kI family restriction endonuclease n=1 Tax=Bradyrhizobium sp. MOS002 TaxID=2133947 RepID=UPI000D133FD7|nr:Eco29kI family restriction endonuclease [Bradyrhizobium sp. MOS002]PSO30907.1 restriction endonuclease [Bradyrhizobium sp. MOS002]
MSEFTPYNPLDKRNLAASVAEALLERKPRPLGDVPRFDGAGIYAIYYFGDFLAYAAIAAANSKGELTVPIYIGKADPAGGRKGGGGLDSEPGEALCKRVREHARSVRGVDNLNIEHFACRLLVVEEQWIGLAEALLIAKFSPVWNTLVDGFGNHPPGKGRHAGMKPRWDVLHPGRPGFDQLQPRAENAQQIADEVEAYLRSVVPPTPPKLLAGDD